MAYRTSDVLILLGIMMIWGGNFAVAKLGLERLPPLFFIALRFAVVAVVLAPFVKPPLGRMRQIYALSLTLGVLHFALMFTALKTLDAAAAAILVQLQVPMASLMAWFIFKDALGWRRAAGMALAIVGVVVIVGEPHLDGHYLALAMVLAGAFMWAVANVQVKLMGPVDGTQLNAWVAIFAAPQLLLVSLALEDGQWQAIQNLDAIAVFAVFYQSLAVVVLGYGLWYRLLHRYDLNQVMPFTLTLPVFGVLSGILVLGESVSWTFLFGGLLTLIGVGIIVLRRPRIAAPETQRL